MASRKITDLHPDLQPICQEHVRLAALEGVDALVYCTFRSNTEQDEEYAKGRTKPGAIVTNAKAGQSKHNFMIDGKPAAKAYDMVPVVNGRAVWNAKDPAWQVLGRIGEGLGLDWYGHPGSKFREMPHFQLKG